MHVRQASTRQCREHWVRRNYLLFETLDDPHEEAPFAMNRPQVGCTHEIPPPLVNGHARCRVRIVRVSCAYSVRISRDLVPREDKGFRV